MSALGHRDDDRDGAHDKNPLNPMGRAGSAPVPVHPWKGATGLGQRKIFRADLAPHLVGLELESELLALGQSGKTRALDCADVNEHIIAAVIGLNEPEALLGVEPLHSTCRHFLLQSAEAHPARQSRGLNSTSSMSLEKSPRAHSTRPAADRMPLTYTMPAILQ